MIFYAILKKVFEEKMFSKMFILRKNYKVDFLNCFKKLWKKDVKRCIYFMFHSFAYIKSFSTVSCKF